MTHCVMIRIAPKNTVQMLKMMKDVIFKNHPLDDSAVYFIVDILIILYTVLNKRRKGGQIHA